MHALLQIIKNNAFQLNLGIQLHKLTKQTKPEMFFVILYPLFPMCNHERRTKKKY